MKFFIPAKGYSTRIPRKNMAILGGAPLLHWTLHKCRRWFPEVDTFVATDDDEIRQYAADMGCRHYPLSEDDSADRRLATFLFFEFLRGIPADEKGMLLQITSPFTFRSEIERAMRSQVACQSGYEAVLFAPDEVRKSQNIPLQKVVTGNFNVVPGGTNAIPPGGWAISPVNWLSAIDIDAPEDLEMCRWLARKFTMEDFNA